MQCDVNHCPHDAAYKVKLKMRVHEGGAVAEGDPGLFVCEEHKAITLDDIFPTEVEWALVTTSFVAHGFARPSRYCSEVVLEALQ